MKCEIYSANGNSVHKVFCRYLRDYWQWLIERGAPSLRALPPYGCWFVDGPTLFSPPILRLKPENISRRLSAHSFHFYRNSNSAYLGPTIDALSTNCEISISTVIAILPIWDLPLMPSLQIVAQKNKLCLFKTFHRPNVPSFSQELSELNTKGPKEAELQMEERFHMTLSDMYQIVQS